MLRASVFMSQAPLPASVRTQGSLHLLAGHLLQGAMLTTIACASGGQEHKAMLPSGCCWEHVIQMRQLLLKNDLQQRDVMCCHMSVA